MELGTVLANSVFLEMPPAMIERLRRKESHFYTFIGSCGARFMCSWETREEDIVALLADLEEVAERR